MGLLGRICSFFLVCSSYHTTKQTSQIPVLLPNLPPEIIAEILSRLPVKPLLRFRCVCKSWRSSISNRRFAKTHLNLASSMDTFYTNHRLLIIGVSSSVTSCTLYSILNEHSDIDVVELDYPVCGETRGVLGGVKILGCCDGLMCIESNCTLFLWNPSTRKSWKLPGNLPPTHVEYYGYGFGLGYDASIDDYKVVLLLQDWRSIGIALEVKVYTLRTDSWRRIGDFPHGRPCYRLRPGVFVNGAFHWKLDTNRLIVSLDLVKETYGEFLEPEYQDGGSYEMLCAFNGCLCILYDYRICAEVWVMKEYGKKESWTKLVVVPYDTSTPSYLKYTIPVCILKNGEVLLYTHGHLVHYNPKDGTFTYSTSPIDSGLSIVHPYVESLVSVDMDADSGVPWQHLY